MRGDTLGTLRAVTDIAGARGLTTRRRGGPQPLGRLLAHGGGPLRRHDDVDVPGILRRCECVVGACDATAAPLPATPERQMQSGVGGARGASNASVTLTGVVTAGSGVLRSRAPASRITWGATVSGTGVTVNSVTFVSDDATDIRT